MKVFGVTSIVYPDPYTIENSLHVFMCDFDRIRFGDVYCEAKRLCKENNIDLFIFQTYLNSFHVVGFDILPYQEINRLLKDIRIESDYPLIGERMHDKFLTLRVSGKGSKGCPVYRHGFTSRKNKKLKSLWHYLFYQALCGLPEAPPQYEFVKVPVFCVVYDTRFDTSKKFNVNELLEHNAGHSWNRVKDISKNTLRK